MASDSFWFQQLETTPYFMLILVHPSATVCLLRLVFPGAFFSNWSAFVPNCAKLLVERFNNRRFARWLVDVLIFPEPDKFSP